MRRRALWKDFYMEIRTTLNRFLSIFLIVALGVAFFAGLRATDPDMRITADHYYDISNLMDIRVMSTMGVTKEDVSAISRVEGVETVEPAYSTDVVCNTKSSEIVLKVMSLTEKLNLYTLIEGRMPEKKNEVMVDSNFITSAGLKVGETIKLSSGTEKPLSDTLNQEEFTIVGIGSTPYYLSFQRGSSEIGSGEVDSFIVALPEVFTQEVYTTAYVTVKGAKELTTYTEDYNNSVKDVLENIKLIADNQAQNRYDQIYQKAKDEIIEAQQKIDRFSALAQTSEDKKKLEDAQVKVTEAQAELNKMEKPKWYVLDRNSIEAYVEFEQNSDRIGAIGKVFPAIFFLVAALISLTTMTRMVEEERIQIGTLKALGYSKRSIAMKYMLYALLATLGGSLFGAAIGLKVLPTVIITAYKIMYPGIPKVMTPFNSYYATLATALAVLTVGIATYIACYNELLSKPAQLMRPVAPKSGKRVLLERVPFIWNRLNFTWKATIRNLLRYKKRFFMTIFGIGGCMALLLVGFGLKDSIFVIYTRQFDEIMLYDASVSMKDKASDSQKAELETTIENNSKITSYTEVRSSAIDISYQGTTKSLTMYVPKEVDKFKEYITLRSRIGHEPSSLNEEGILLTEHLAKRLGVDVGDTITIKEGDTVVDAKISGITENYLTHYLYMTPNLYQHLFGKEVKFNQFFLLLPGTDDKTQLEVGNGLLKHPAASGVFYTSYFQNLLSNILVSLNIVVLVLIISAGALAFVVLYNLNNININERRRELATLKVLGFYDKEMAAYVYRENIVLTMIGIVFGIVFGIILHRFVITTVEIDLVMFGRNIDPSSFVYSILLTFLFSAFVNFVMYFKLKKIDMVESLKSVE